MPRPQSPLWISLRGHRLLKGRAGHTATLVGKKLLVIGGRNGSEFFNDLWAFDIQENQWKLLQKHAPLSARAYHTATLVQGNQLWVIGGSDHLAMYGDVHVLNTDTLEWTSPVTKGQVAGKLRGTHAAILHPLQEKGILVHGGYGGLNSQWLSDLAILQTDTLVWEVLQPRGFTPSGRGYHTLTAFGSHVVLLGGKGDAGIISADDISVYDTMMNIWTRPRSRGVIPKSRSNHAATLMDDNLIVIHGGRNGSERLSDLCLLHIISPPVPGCVDSFSWQIIEEEAQRIQKKGKVAKSKGPGGRSAHTLVAEESSLYLFGGYGGNGITFDDIFVIRQFDEVAAVKNLLAGVAAKTAHKASAVGQRTHNETNDIEGWRSTKQVRRSSHQTTNKVPATELHILDSDDGTGENVSHSIPVLAEHAMQDLDRLRPSAGVTKPRPPKSVGNNEVQMTRTDALLNLQDVNHAKTTLEKDLLHGKELARFQRVVDSLKAEVKGLRAEVNTKNLLESEFRAGKLALEQNIQLLQKQVEEGNQKTWLQRTEIERMKLEAQVLSAQVEEKDKERLETIEKMTSSDQKSENLSRSLDKMKATYSEAIQELDRSRLRVHSLQSEVEKQEQEMQQVHRIHEKEITNLNKIVEEKRRTNELLSKELEVSKDSARTLHETLERLAKHVERDNAKIDILETEKAKLICTNMTLSAEQVQLIEARDGAKATLDMAKEELRVAQSLIERNAVEFSRMRENADEAKEHITSLHASLKKIEEELKSVLEENEKIRLIIKETEDFENAYARSIQDHVEKLRCSRQFGSRF